MTHQTRTEMPPSRATLLLLLLRGCWPWRQLCPRALPALPQNSAARSTKETYRILEVRQLVLKAAEQSQLWGLQTGSTGTHACPPLSTTACSQPCDQPIEVLTAG